MDPAVAEVWGKLECGSQGAEEGWKGGSQGEGCLSGVWVPGIAGRGMDDPASCSEHLFHLTLSCSLYKKLMRVRKWFS